MLVLQLIYIIVSKGKSKILRRIYYFVTTSEDSKSRQKTTITLKVALISKQSNEIVLLKDDINLERREKETFRLENEQLKMIVNNEKEANKMLRDELI